MADYSGFFGGGDKNSQASRTKLSGEGAGSARNGIEWNERWTAMRLILLTLHIGGGIFGILAGAVAMCFRKGSRWHALAGQVFVAAMLTMSACGATLAVMRQ